MHVFLSLLGLIAFDFVDSLCTVKSLPCILCQMRDIFYYYLLHPGILRGLCGIYDGKRGNYMGLYPSFVSLIDITLTMNVLLILVSCRDILVVLVSIHFLGSHTIAAKSVLYFVDD